MAECPTFIPNPTTNHEAHSPGNHRANLEQQKEVRDMGMGELAEHFSKFSELKKPVTYIRNGLGNW